ncbi:hypothetical protein ACF061_00575 [Streptomyces sp. NPDC015220]|uniref:hypothetical protein n=1 Tax=Streptomyces sp. NPDC015220 TaxID=3364947 RepID=UPI0036FE80B5
MPTPDSYGQGIGLWQMTDAPSIPDAIALFAKGVLPRLTLTFASASARGATLVKDATPIPGMMTWLTDVGRLDMWDGTTWVTVSVGNRAWTTVPLASGWAHNGSDNGTFQYRLVNEAGAEIIQFRGGISRASYPSPVPGSWTLTSTPLPSSARPSTKRTVSVPCSDVNSVRISLKMDVQADGHLSLWGTQADTKPPWVAFNGVFASL